MSSSHETLNGVFNSLVETSNSARLSFSRGSRQEALQALQDVCRTARFLEDQISLLLQSPPIDHGNTSPITQRPDLPHTDYSWPTDDLGRRTSPTAVDSAMLAGKSTFSCSPPPSHRPWNHYPGGPHSSSAHAGSGPGQGVGPAYGSDPNPYLAQAQGQPPPPPPPSSHHVSPRQDHPSAVHDPQGMNTGLAGSRSGTHPAGQPHPINSPRASYYTPPLSSNPSLSNSQSMAMDTGSVSGKGTGPHPERQQDMYYQGTGPAQYAPYSPSRHNTDPYARIPSPPSSSVHPGQLPRSSYPPAPFSPTHAVHPSSQGYAPPSHGHGTWAGHPREHADMDGHHAIHRQRPHSPSHPLTVHIPPHQGQPTSYPSHNGNSNNSNGNHHYHHHHHQQQQQPQPHPHHHQQQQQPQHHHHQHSQYPPTHSQNMYATTPHERSRSPLSPQQSASSDRYPGDGHYQPWAKSSSTSALPSAHPGHVASHQSRIAALLNDDDNDADYPHGSPPTKRVAKDSDREMSHSASHSPAVLHPSEPKRSLGQSERTTNSQVPRSITTNHIATSGSTVSATTGGSTSSGGGGGSVGSRTQFHAPLEPEVVQRLDELFFKFLQRICSDLDARDSKGDHIHQPLMAKKMQRLEASADFRPFKFRIQAFTNAFHESLIQHGLSEDILPLRKVKVYLWKHKYISRFNEDGKKQKSKGNHVWNIEARRIAPPPAPGSSSSSSSSLSSHGKGSSASTAVANSSYYSSSTMVNSRFKSEHEAGSTITTSTGGTVSLTRPPSPPIQWEFREYTSRIAGQIIKFARVGVRYTYTPKIWDAQMSCPEAEYSSPWLPPWLKWENKELVGTPSAEDKSCTITVKAVYDREGTKCELETSFPITILHQDETEDGSEKDEEEAEQLKKAASGGRGRPPLLPKPTTAAKSTQQLPNDATSEAEREPAEDDMEIDSTRENQSQQQEENKRYLRSNRSSQQRRPRRHDDDDGADGEIDEDEREKGGEDEGEEGEDEEEDDEDDGDAMNVEYEDRSGDGDYEDDDDVLNGPDSEGIEDEDEEMAEDEHGEPFSGGRQHRGQPSSPSHRRRSSAGGASSSSSNGRRRSSSSTSGRGRRSSMSGIRGVGATAGKVNRASRRETNGPVSRTASTKEAKRPRQ